MNLMAHIIAARRLWLYRLGGATERPAGLFPASITHAELVAGLAAMEEGWSAYLAHLSAAELGQTFEYRTTEGDMFRSNVADVLTQLYGHSLYHRGQIASLVRALGGQPAETDFIFWSREPVLT